MDYKVMVCGHRDHYINEAYRTLSMFLPEEQVGIFNGAGAPSCSWAWNQTALACSADVCIICNEKARPHRNHVQKIVRLVNDGYALVGLYRFGFFGFNRKVLACLGFFDERYLGGHYEDDDMILRIGEIGLAYYETEEVPYLQVKSAWTHDEAHKHHAAKWEQSTIPFTRKLEEPNYNYEIDGEIPDRLLGREHTVFIRQHLAAKSRKTVCHWIEKGKE